MSIQYSLSNLIEKIKERDEARGNYSGHSWGYVGADLERDVRNAEREFINDVKEALKESDHD